MTQTQTPAILIEDRQTTIIEQVIFMARTVERSVDRVIEALLVRNHSLANAVFMDEPRINELEIKIDELVVEALCANNLPEAGIRLMVATLKINHDLERMGDLAVNIAERVVSLAKSGEVEDPLSLQPMAIAVSHMCRKTLRALIHRDLALAKHVLESDDTVDHHRDRVLQCLRERMSNDPARVAQDIDLLLASRHLERIADHATNISEDVIYWLRGVDVRHGRGKEFEITASGGQFAE